MRILHVIAQKPDNTGSGVYLTSLVKAFDRAGHKQAVIAGVTADDPCAFPKSTRFYPVYFESDQLPFSVVGMSDVMPYASTRYRDITPEMLEQFEQAFVSTLKQAVEEFKPDQIFCHHLYLLTAIVRETVSDVPVHAFCHSTDLRQIKQHNLERNRIISGVQKVDHILSLHHAQAADIVDVFNIPVHRINVVGIGYDAHRFKPSENTKSQKNTHTNILFAGKIAEKKGVLSLLRALEKSGLNPEHTTLRLAGGHSNEQEYQEALDLATHSSYSIEFLGRLTQDELAAEYQRADIFVLPSFFEGLPLVVIEALACGCKVVVTDLPGVRPWIEAQAPEAPVRYVTPPDLCNTDEPVAETLPAFEQRLADALSASAADTPHKVCLNHLSWDSLVKNLVEEGNQKSACAENDDSLRTV